MSKHLNRREFLQITGAAAGVAAAGALGGALSGCNTAAWASVHTLQQGGTDKVVCYGYEAGDPVVQSAPVQWAISELAAALQARGIPSINTNTQAAPASAAIRIHVGGPESPGARSVLNQSTSEIAIPLVAESCALVSTNNAAARTTLATGRDARGMVYAILELADRVKLAPTADAAVAALAIPAPLVETPANKVRSVFRMFSSEIEDKSWYYDRAFWREYLTMLAYQRFNRFNLSLGLSYDFSRNVTDSYFFFAYPFLVDVPGHRVRPVNPRTGGFLPEEERARNLATLRFISDEAAARGLHFQLGIWTHSYQWTNSPNVNYNIDGIDAQSQGPYCRDAMFALLEACPNIKGLNLRTHGESGVPEGNYALWKTIMSGAAGHKLPDGKPRIVEFDLHGKGITQEMIDTAISINAGPVYVTPKFTAEHMGLPYMQASIRDLELPRQDGTGLMALSGGSRNHMRYSFGDILTTNRKYGVITRVWPGTQRLLLWGDPEFAAWYSRCMSFCGMDGVEYFEPLSFKGRAGSGVDETAFGGQRGGYSDASLRPTGGDWQKYLYWYRLMGRMAYNPQTPADVWQRFLKSEYGDAAGSVEKGLAQSSRILPLITSSHQPSGANFNYWPEMYTNMSIHDPARYGSYSDSPTPRVFNTVSPIDPQIFATVNETALALLAGKPLGKVTSLEVAAQLEAWANGSLKEFAAARGANAPAFRRAQVDAAIAAGLGLFFAHKYRAAVLWAIYDRTGEESARTAAVEAYGRARAAWAALSEQASVYVNNLPFGNANQLRGHWKDRLPAIDQDIESMKSKAAANIQPARPQNLAAIIAGITSPSTPRIGLKFDHTAANFTPGQALQITARPPGASAVKLWYRHINQGERYQSLEMTRSGEQFQTAIPGDYTRGVFPIQYYFEVTTSDGKVATAPGFGPDFTGCPYFVAGA